MATAVAGLAPTRPSLAARAAAAARGAAVRAFAPTDILPLVLFRVVYGAVALWEVWRYFDHGWIERYWVRPEVYFTYYGFGWVRPWPGEGMTLHFVGLGVLAAMIALGLWYRVATVLFTLGFAYVFLLDQTRYLNHFYLFALIGLLLAVVPANRAGSLDARLRPALRSATAPTWGLWVLRAQVAIAYVYGGIAKLNGDWLQGEPMRTWLAARTDFPVIGRFFTDEWMVYAFSYGGLLFDLAIVPLLLWRRTLPFALGLSALFHLTNAELFQIGIFPWFMLFANVLFLPPSWLRLGAPAPAALKRQLRAATKAATAAPARLGTAQRVTLGLLGAYLAFQLLMPFRHALYPGNVSWTEEGHNFAWHMKLRNKEGDAVFYVTDPASGQTWPIEPDDFLANHQESKVGTHPEVILQFAHYLARRFAEAGYPNVEVRATVHTSLNGREPQLLIDPTVDLTKERRSLLPTDWILPLEKTL